MNELMEFLAGLVRLVHADRYYKNLLIKNRGSSYLDIITASDIAYVVSLIKNSDNVWLKRKTPDGSIVKSLYTSGKGIKREYGVTTWKKSGMQYYREVMEFWKTAFHKNHRDYKTIRKHWDKWIESMDGGRKFMLGEEHTNKTAYKVLATRSEEFVEDDDDDVDDSEEFKYESDPEENTYILSNWNHRNGGRGPMTNINNSDDEDCVDGGDSDEDNDDGATAKAQDEDDVEESDDDDDDDRSMNGFGQILEEEALASGMAPSGSKTKKRKSAMAAMEREGIATGRERRAVSTRGGWK